MCKKFYLLILLSIFSSISAYQTDYDYIAIGSSPIMMLEALYHHHLGNRVMIVEGAEECGGAWKSIEICGIKHVDMGCHTAGGNTKMIDFLENYVGINMVPMVPNDKGKKKSHGNYYPQAGCYELIEQILKLVSAANIPLSIGHKVSSIYLHENLDYADVLIDGRTYTTKKLLVCHGTELNNESEPSYQNSSPREFPHIYLLVKDSSPDHFIYTGGGAHNGLSIVRVSNLTPYCDLNGSDKKIFAFEVRSKTPQNFADLCLDYLHSKSLIGKNARLLNSETYTYSKAYLPRNFSNKLSPKGKEMFVYVNTTAIWNIANFASAWEKVFPLYQEVARAR